MRLESHILTLCTAFLLFSGCSGAELTEPAESTEESLTVNAVSDWGFVAFSGDAAASVSVTDPSGSTSWDIAFYGISTMLNGGAAGPGEVVGYCLCQNAGASDAAILAMTPDGQRPAFEAVASAHVPTDAGAWQSDVFSPAINGWWRYDPAVHQVSAVPSKSWYLRTASGSAFAKFRVTSIEGATEAHAGMVTFEFALQPTAGAPLGPTHAVQVNVAGGAVHFDLATASPVGEGVGWDLLFDGYDIRVNGGVSGNGSAGALPTEESFEAITDASGGGAPFFSDAFGGVFADHPWYRYNLQGNRFVHPTYDVYLIRKGAQVYKIQVTSYYSAAGASRHITFRYALVQ